MFRKSKKNQSLSEWLVGPASQVVLTVLTVALAVLTGLNAVPHSAQAAGGTLSVTIIAAPNLVVDSNALATSTYAPKVATVIGKFCASNGSVDNVTAYIGDYTGSGTIMGTPGTYPSKADPTVGGLTYQGDYAFTHLGGAADAARYMGTLADGECRYQYWSFEYPHYAINASGGSTIPTWGVDVKPTDDLSLDFAVWAIGDGGLASANKTHTATMRNEISAMANKIKPNGNPSGQWFNTDTSVVYPGQTVTTNGILYRLGNVNQGFDNDGDGVPDYNAWLQPFGDPAYDPSCFRLVSVSGVLTVTRSAGNPDMLIPIDNNLYFTNLPPDNTDVRGEVFYEFLALGGACTVPISPYQEVASGSDNEKFNGDYGTGVPALMSYEPEVTITKSGPGMQAENTTFTYQIPFVNNSTTAQAGLTLSSGGVNAGMMISDAVPIGLQYVAGSASSANSIPAGNSVSIRYSTDSGLTWSTTDPGDTLSTAGSRVIIQWWLNEPLDVSGSGANSGYVRYQATIPSGYITGGGTPFIENCAEASFGDGTPFDRACADTLVQGTASIGDWVWQDENRDGSQAGESGIGSIQVSLYYDKNGDGKLDAGDVLISQQDSSAGSYDFTQLPAGDYIVKVDAADDNLPTGYGLTTTGYYAVTLSAGQDYNDADFGFGPSLRVDKHLESLNPAYVGETVTFHIDLVNRLPGDGTASGFCVYKVWAGAATTSGNANQMFATPENAIGAPNLTYAIGDFSTGGNNELTGSSYSAGGRTSGISKVEVIANVYFDKFLSNDQLRITANGTDNVDTTGTVDPWVGSFTTAEANAYAPAESKKGDLIAEIPANYAPGGSWDWGDFASLSVLFAANKTGGGDEANINVDALGFRVTTNDTSCADGDTTIAVLPFTDTYDTTYLEFLSADPPPTNHNEATGTLTWDNLGPLYAGGKRTIAVNFKAKATIVSPGTTNTGSVTGARFSSGRSVNDASDTAQVYINASGSISGRVFADTNAPGAWNATNGYSTGDTFIPGVTVELWGCFNKTTDVIIDETNDAPNKPCTDVSNNGEWRLIRTLTTDSNGAYSFTGLRDGYYNVHVVDTTLPTDFTTNSVETNATGNGGGGAGGDDWWNVDTANLTTFNPLANGASGENVTVVSFGYIDGGGTTGQGAVIGYAWHDLDGDGVWDAGEQPIAGVSVYLCTTTPCNASTPGAVLATTDDNGRYAFGNVAPGTNAYYVGVTTPNAMSQSGDPDGNLDNQTTNAFSVVANGISGPYNFGYTGGLSIGDTIYADWNGDGTPDDGEEGIGGVQVRLYRDLDGDGVIDPGDTLLGTQTTDADGYYQFTNLPGNGAKYLVFVGESTLPAGYVQTADPDSSKDNKTVVTLDSTSVDTADFGYRPRGFNSIGDTVWNDANGNGVQDAGESGLNGVTVNLYQDQNGDGVIDSDDDALVASITTGIAVRDGYLDVDGDGSITGADDSPSLLGIRVIDGKLDINNDGVVNTLDDGTFAGYTVIGGLLDMNGTGGVTTDDDGTLNGLYQFRDLPAGAYIVEIPIGNFGSGQPLYGLTQSYDPDSATVRDNQDQVTLQTGVITHYVLGDFGYTASSIGDFVWRDDDGDGLLDTNETGINGVVVELYLDANNDGVADGAAIATATTANNSEGKAGYYLFGGLSANNYIVKVATSNFQPGGALYDSTAGTAYAQTYDPNAYNSSSPSLSCLTDGAEGCDNTNWLQGVTYGGVFFPGLQLGQNDVSSDFGYQPPAVIGDFVWQDLDGDGVQDAGEPGIPNVDVFLCASPTTPPCSPGSGNYLAAATTDSEGYYYFTGRPAGTYVVSVDTADLPAGMTQTGDPDASLDDSGSADTTGNVSDLSMDFGYRGSRLISGTIFFDKGELGGTYQSGTDFAFQGVYVYLYDSDGKLVGSTTTNADGFYQFNVASGVYTVKFGQVLSTKINGMTLTYEPDEAAHDSYCGTTPPTCDNSATVDVTSGDKTNQDVGYFASMDMGDLPNSYNYNILMEHEGPIHINTNGGAYPTIYLGTKWDAEKDGTPDSGAGMNGGSTGGDDNTPSSAYDDEDGVDFRGETWAPGKNVQMRFTLTDNDTAYLGYLVGWFDWNQNGNFNDAGEMILFGEISTLVGTGEFSKDWLLSIPSSAKPGGVINMRFRLYATQSPPPVIAPTGTVLNGEVEDYQKDNGTTRVTLSSFRAYTAGSQVVVEWQTASEVGTLGFYLGRLDEASGQFVQLNAELLPGLLTSEQGGTYRYVDTGASAGGTYTYQLVEIEVKGKERAYGPFAVTVEGTGPQLDPGQTYSSQAHGRSAEQQARVEAAKASREEAKAMKKERKGESIKIVVSQDGLYYLDAAEIAPMLGMNVQQAKSMIKTGNLALSSQGQAVAYLPADGNAGLYFYGQAVDSMYTTENVYWLKKDQGLRMAQVTGKGPAPAGGQASFTAAVHLEKDNWALTGLFTDPQADYWAWDYVYAAYKGLDSKSYTLRADGAAATGMATLTAHLVGATDTKSNPDHHVVVSLNGVVIGEGRWDGTKVYELALSFDQALLKDGDNTLKVAGLRDAGVSYSIFYIDSFDLGYRRRYRAVDNALLVRGEGRPVVTIEGYSEPGIWVFDVSDARQPKLVAATTVDKVGGAYRVSFAPVSPDALYLAVARSKALAPGGVYADVVSGLAQAGNSADYVVIAPLELKEAAGALAAYRQGQGLAAMVVELEDIYDEFNWGLSSPEAIRAFLAYAYTNWQVAPRYVVLAGEGTFDYKGNQGYSDNLLPAVLVGTPHGLFASDNWFADVAGGDGVPEMAVGRLPVVSPAELQAQVAKIAAYESAPAGDWQKRVMMVADNPDQAGNFPVDSDDVAALLPAGYVADKTYLGRPYTTAQARQRIRDGLNSGAVLLNYIGHGGMDRFAQEGLLTSGDVSTLNNGGRLPVVTAMTCVAGRYEVPGYDSLGEQLVLGRSGGAVAVWSPTGLSYNEEAKILSTRFFQAAFVEGHHVLGDVVLEALEEYGARGNMPFMPYIYTLLGDPALRIK